MYQTSEISSLPLRYWYTHIWTARVTAVSCITSHKCEDLPYLKYKSRIPGTNPIPRPTTHSKGDYLFHKDLLSFSKSVLCWVFLQNCCCLLNELFPELLGIIPNQPRRTKHSHFQVTCRVKKTRRWTQALISLVWAGISDDLWNAEKNLASPYHFQLHFILHLQDARWDLNCQHFTRGEGGKKSLPHRTYMYTNKNLFPEISIQSTKLRSDKHLKFLILIWSRSPNHCQPSLTLSSIQIKQWLILVYCFLEAYLNYFLIDNQVYLLAGKHFRLLILPVHWYFKTWHNLVELNYYKLTTIALLCKWERD